MPFTQADLLRALHDCFDPQLKCNIVDLGLVDSLSLQEDLEAPGRNIPGVPQKYRATITLIPTNTDELWQSQMAAQIENRLAGLENISTSKAAFITTKIWTPDRISPAGRRTLGLDRPKPNQLVEIKLP
ncbi:metal-sulfur cluster assembly factor [Terriglobus saanensis]|uniref:MIP18 family-like domain-containing protein n=1 Tax=Terriglobus saanensis (strain ATCC BAA-1853 / DSM 23119 / SP1PR4) TaxID=401053 RepID=E8V557_TERSS|nr:hypothetical protein [Terriglobus saanensis]ADV83744.1 protein of unknown function DUF59 [Terriglobus saanensis SP1PR4]